MNNIIGTSVAVTPSDTVNFPTGRCVGLYIGLGGIGQDVSLVDDTGTNQIFANVLTGTVYPFACTRVNATGTTAAGIRALYSN